MKKPTNNPKFIPSIYCRFFGHNYQITRKVTNHVKEYNCKHCKNEVTTNSNGKLTKLTPMFKEINSILEQIHTTKTDRLKKKSFVSSIY
ncbi:hypothetical protein SAMN05216261_0692 [Algibacter luteus]|uniref:Prophage protein n=1 Tax=Algibacter luteus TaxID=1178825 RepID=A0A1M6AYP3_9FLAO|nr:hypothetical protein [Algibacter luteus]SHI41576.1 hypothetical protein SAMN05216261_0692 [Algibacter luteus]